MSDEIYAVNQLQCRNGNLVIPLYGDGQSIDQSRANGGGPGHIIVGTAEEDVDLSDFTTPGRVWIKNNGYTGTGTDGTPYVTFGPKSGTMVAFAELKEGEEAGFRFTRTSPTLTIKSSMEDTSVQIVILDD